MDGMKMLTLSRLMVMMNEWNGDANVLDTDDDE